jgi:PKD repeat protein
MKTCLFNFTLALIGLSVASTELLAQTEPCGSGILHNHMLEHDSHYARAIFNHENRLLQFQAEGNYRDEEVFTVPVVVHVIHEGEPLGQGSNISDEQVISAIEALNEDFRHVPGTNGYGDGVDVGIDFCLASRDPNGNSTNGIIRVNGSSVPDYAEEGISSVNGIGASETAVKALSTWPRQDYMNIWIVNEIEDNDGLGGIQGYAYFPANTPLDGIVILHNVFGTVGNLKPGQNLNRTATHEVGHYFALYHTFHNTNNCSAEANCNTAGDRCCDTPVTVLQSSCASPACSGNQQVENYMDYTPESCKNMFSQGQKDRMRATIISSRATLLESLGCAPVTDYDAGITSINHPVGALCNATFQAEVQITNFGSQAITSLTITYGVVGNAASTYNWSGNVSSGSSTTITLPNYSTTVGNHTFFAAASMPSGQNDEYLVNDELEQEFVVANGAGAVLTVTVDYFGSETTWDIFDELGTLLISGGPYVDNQQGTQFVENLCLASGCFDLVVYDEYGDGMGFTNGNFQLHDAEGNLLGNGVGNFGEEITVNFCLEAAEVADPPIAAFSAADQTVCTGTQVDFTNQSQNAVSYSWVFSGGSPGTSNQQHPQNITYANPGTYSVTLTATNAEGTQNTLTLTSYITVSGGPSLSMNTNAVECFGQSNGSAAVTASGYSPFTYSWNNGDLDANAGNLSAGTYTVTVTDSYGCSSNSNASITQPSALSLNLSSTNVSCNGGNNGSVSASASGGNGGFTFNWSGLGANASYNNLSAGQYQVTVTDSEGCSANGSRTITQPSAIQLNLQVFDASCDAAQGTAIVAPTGGTGALNTVWSNGATGNNSGNLNPGNYTVTVTDANGCSKQENFNIQQISNLSLNVVANNVLCFGAANGSAQALVIGGEEPYEYVWNTGSTAQGITGLIPGSYNVTVTDANGCSGSATGTITEPTELNLSIVQLSPVSCEMNDGSASVQVNGGTEPYSVVWTSGSNDFTANGLGNQSYMAMVTDANGCVEAASIFIELDCEESMAGPQLIDTDCGATDVMIGDVITCEAVEGATMYLWRFESAASGLLTEEYTIGGNNQFYLNSITNLSYGITIDVRIKALVNDEWTAFGEMCQLHMNENVPNTSLTKADCGTEGLQQGSELHCVAVAGADEYEWIFTDIDGAEIIVYSFVNSINIDMNEGFVPNQSYQVSVTARVGEQWSVAGISCEVSFGDVLAIEEQGEPALIIYPNPGNGSEIFLQAYNLSENTNVSDLTVYDGNGKIVEVFTLNHPGRRSFKTGHQFSQRLSAGMYFLSYELGNNQYQQKMIVR